VIFALFGRALARRGDFAVQQMNHTHRKVPKFCIV
jgi:hypothetical protein